MTRRLKTADDKLRELIDEYVAVDDLYKIANTERDRLRKLIIRKLRYGHRGYGVHPGNVFAINTYQVRRKQFSQAKAQELLGPQLYKRAFKTQKYIQIDALDPNESVSSIPDQKEAVDEQQ